MDLGDWASTPAAVVRDGKIAFLPAVPPLAEWTAQPPDPDANPAGIGNMAGGVGNILGL